MYDSRIERTYAKPFNEGSDARLAGKSVNRNPYDKELQFGLWRYWRIGWNHVEDFWGDKAKGRWPVTPLVEVI